MIGACLNYGFYKTFLTKLLKSIHSKSWEATVPSHRHCFLFQIKLYGPMELQKYLTTLAHKQISTAHLMRMTW